MRYLFERCLLENVRKVKLADISLVFNFLLTKLSVVSYNMIIKNDTRRKLMSIGYELTEVYCSQNQL